MSTTKLEWADPTGNQAVRNIRLAAAVAQFGDRLDRIESYVISNPATGYRAVSKTLGIPRKKVAAALDLLVELDRVRVIGDMYV